MIVTVLKINRTTAIIIPIPIITSMEYILVWFNTTLTGVLRSVGGPATRDTRLINNAGMRPDTKDTQEIQD